MYFKTRTHITGCGFARQGQSLITEATVSKGKEHLQFIMFTALHILGLIQTAFSYGIINTQKGLSH